MQETFLFSVTNDFSSRISALSNIIVKRNSKTNIKKENQYLLELESYFLDVFLMVITTILSKIFKNSLEKYLIVMTKHLVWQSVIVLWILILIIVKNETHT